MLACRRLGNTDAGLGLSPSGQRLWAARTLGGARRPHPLALWAAARASQVEVSRPPGVEPLVQRP